MAKRSSILLCAVLLVFTGTATLGQENSGTTKVAAHHEANTRRLLELTGGSKIAEQIWNQLFGTIKNLNQQVPEGVWEEINKEFSTELTAGKITDLLVPIYSTHFSDEEIDQLIRFYESPIGKKLVSAQPQILMESMDAGQRWAADVLKRVQESLKKKGFSMTAG